MSSGFAPSLADDAKAGVPVTRKAYPDNGVPLALKEIAKRIREGGRSSAVQGVAFDILTKAGFTGRGSPADAKQSGSYRERAKALLDWVRQNTLYAQDPPNTEFIKSAEALLCLRPQLCVRIGDCDDMVVLLGSLLMATGIPCKVIKQSFGGSSPEHVLIEAYDEDNRAFPLDPSYDYPAGSKAQGAVSEVRMDPLSNADLGLDEKTHPEAEFITVGKLGKFGAHQGPPGFPQGPATLQDFPAIPNGYVVVTDGSIVAGLRYMVGVLAPAMIGGAGWSVLPLPPPFPPVLIPAPSGTPWVSDDTVQLFQAMGWHVENVVQVAPTNPAFSGWVVTGISRSNMILQDTAQVKYVLLAKQVAPPLPSPPEPPAPPAASSTSMAVPIAIGVGVVAIGVAALSYGKWWGPKR